MGIFDIFKKKKKPEEKKRKVEPREKKAKKPQTPKPRRKRIPKKSKAYRVLKGPHITEKSTDLAGKNQYTFLVWQEANKVQVKKAVEDIYNVKVIDVKVVNIPPKRRRLGRAEGWRKRYKKAVVKVKKGQKIDIFPT